MAITLSAKAPTAVYRYSWKPDVVAGDTLASHTLTVASGAATVNSSALSSDNLSVDAFIAGGTAGTACSFTATAVSVDGETFSETIYLPIFGPGVTIGETAQDYVNFALRKIVGVGESASGDELADGLEQFNGMLALWRIDGLDVGATFPLLSSTVLSIRDEFSMAVKYNLRVILHGTYGPEAMSGLTQTDIEMARDGKRLVANALLTLDDLKFETNLLPRTQRGWYKF